MGRVVAIGEGEALDGLRLCGADVVSLEDAHEATVALAALGADVDLVIVTSAVARERRAPLEGHVLEAVVPE